MKTFIVLFMMALLLAVSASGSKEHHMHSDDPFTKHLDDSILKVTEKGLFSVEMAIPEKRLKPGVSWSPMRYARGPLLSVHQFESLP